MIRLFTLILAVTGCALPGIAADETPRDIPAVAQPITVPGAEAMPLRALLFLPERVSRPPVIALHSCTGIGLADRPIRLSAIQQDWAARLVAAGHPVLFPDSFGSRGLGQACGVPGFPAGPYGVRRLDTLAVAEWVQTQPWGGAPVLIGWSHGGSTSLAAWDTARAGLLNSAIALYPGCGQGNASPTGTAPMLMLLGAADDWTRPEPCQRIAGRAPDLITIETYAGAHHGFDGLSGGIRTRNLPNGRTVSVGPDPAARMAARERVAGFLAQHAGTR